MSTAADLRAIALAPPDATEQDRALLAELLEEAWRRKAPRRRS